MGQSVMCDEGHKIWGVLHGQDEYVMLGVFVAQFQLYCP